MNHFLFIAIVLTFSYPSHSKTGFLYGNPEEDVIDEENIFGIPSEDETEELGYPREYSEDEDEEDEEDDDIDDDNLDDDPFSKRNKLAKASTSRKVRNLPKLPSVSSDKLTKTQPLAQPKTAVKIARAKTPAQPITQH